MACPAKAQAQKWFDEINAIIEADPGLRASLVQTRQQPYYTFRFTTGSTINIFTTGSSSGRDADVIRSQSPRRVRIDEQDLLNPGDYNAILPLLRRYPDSEFHGSSTPTGKRETYYSMCEEFPDYRELHFPIMRHPDFNEEMEKASRREARTELNYMHEFLAEFGELEGGVFKAAVRRRGEDGRTPTCHSSTIRPGNTTSASTGTARAPERACAWSAITRTTRNAKSWMRRRSTEPPWTRSIS